MQIRLTHIGAGLLMLVAILNNGCTSSSPNNASDTKNIGIQTAKMNAESLAKAEQNLNTAINRFDDYERSEKFNKADSVLRHADTAGLTDADKYTYLERMKALSFGESQYEDAIRITRAIYHSSQDTTNGVYHTFLYYYSLTRAYAYLKNCDSAAFYMEKWDSLCSHGLANPQICDQKQRLSYWRVIDNICDGK